MINNPPYKLNIGCGSIKSPPGFIGIDRIKYPHVDIVGDALSIMKSFSDSSVQEIIMSHFLNHVDNWIDYFKEIERILTNGGVVKITCPHFSNPYFYSDPTHINTTGLYTMSYYLKEELFQRKVPKYFDAINLSIEQVHLVFKSPKPFYVRYLIKKIFNYVFNLNYYTQEFYEENLSSIIPAYEIIFKVVKK